MIYIIHPIEAYYLDKEAIIQPEQEQIHHLCTKKEGQIYKYLCWLYNEPLSCGPEEWTWNWRHNE